MPRRPRLATAGYADPALNRAVGRATLFEDMKPVFMILGQSAAVAAALSLEAGCAPQDLPYAVLRPKLEEVGQMLYADAAQQLTSA